MRVRFWLVAAVLACCLLGGGSSWESTLSLLYLRPILILLSAALLMVPAETGAARLRWPAALLAAFAATMAIQLVPLPPTWWHALPGREPYADVARLVGQANLWRPITLSPDRTVNSMLALLPAAAVLIGARGLTRRDLEDLTAVLLVMILTSALLGVVQWSGAGYLYRLTSPGFPTGFLINRNHQAVFLSAGFPLLRILPDILRRRGVAPRPWHAYAAVAAALFLIAIVITTGSRAGLAASLAALLLSIPLTPPIGRVRWTRVHLWRVIGAVAILAMLVGALFFFGRAVSIDRLTDADNYTAELRVRYTPLLIDLVRHYGWAGSGFGTFDAVFRTWEPDWALMPTYFNRAHNEVFETVITGGVPALAVVTAFLIWVAGRLITAWRGTGSALGRLGGIIVGLFCAASVVDYPLRTPLLSAVFALAVVWLTVPGKRREADNPVI